MTRAAVGDTRGIGPRDTPGETPPGTLVNSLGESILPLELEHVGFAHRGQQLLHAISLRLERDGKTVILGPNGAGKSLLMRLCHGLLTPSSGMVRWTGSLGGQPMQRQRRQAMVFQRPVMLRRSALDNVAYALRVHGRSRPQAALEAGAALAAFGLETLAGRPARVLSGGEQQRLALARAWALRPEILFLDEPTSALDPAAVMAVEEALQAFSAHGTRIVMSTHDLGQARRLADEVIFLCGGRLLEFTPAHASPDNPGSPGFFESPRSAQARAFMRGELVW